MRNAQGPLQNWVNLSSFFLTIFMLGFFVCVVGFGDTNQVSAFGFIYTSSSSSLANLSASIADLCMSLTLITFGLLMVLLWGNGNFKRSAPTPALNK